MLHTQFFSGLSENRNWSAARRSCLYSPPAEQHTSWERELLLTLFRTSSPFGISVASYSSLIHIILVPQPLPQLMIPYFIGIFLHNLLHWRIYFNFPEILHIKFPILDFFQLLIVLTHFMLKFGQSDRNESSF